MNTETNSGTRYIDVVFDRPPGPEPPRFVEVENEHRRSIVFGEWVERPDGRWALRFPVGSPGALAPPESTDSVT